MTTVYAHLIFFFFFR